MKRFIPIIAAILLPFSAHAQDAQRQDETIKRIVEASAALESFSCDFEQVREIAILSEADVSKGQMQYRKDGRILWRYTSPEAYQIAFTKDAVVITRDGQTQNMSLADNPYLGGLRELLLGIMSGGQFAGDGQFEVSVVQYEPEIVVSMTPVRRQLRRLFKDVSISFSSKDFLVSRVILTDADGGSTRISFSNQKTN